MLCFKCSKYFNSLDILVIHLKNQHSVNTNEQIICVENKCFRHFSGIKSFRRHVVKFHALQEGKDASYCKVTEVSQQTNQSKVFETVSEAENNFSSDTLPSSQCVHTTFKKEIETFVSYLYNSDTIPRTEVQNIIARVSDLFQSSFVKHITAEVTRLLNTFNCKNSDRENLQYLFTKLQNPFDGLKSEYLRLQYFKKSGNYIQPEVFHIQNEIKKTTLNCLPDVSIVEHASVVIPLRELLKKIFELPSIYMKTKEYIDSLESSPDIENVVQSSFWKQKKQIYKDKEIYPINIYYDEYQTGNVLGSHTVESKLGAVYLSLPCFPPEHQSVLRNIFLCQLFKASDKKKYGNSIFMPVINEIIFLQSNGICITVDNKNIHIYFILVNIVGDNLGLNSILGFVECFSANFFCRICKIDKNNAKSQICEKLELLRTNENYDIDIVTNNCTLTGIKEKCVWHNIDNFHLTTNACVDIMHDLLEGVCGYDLSLILNYFIYEIALFPLQTLNAKIETFEYGAVFNKPPTISEINLKKNNIKMSASEMLCFVTFLGPMIGHLIPKDSSHWQLYICLRNILDIILHKSINAERISLLESLISEHHCLYSVQLKQNLKPKFHNMVHYPRLLRRFGPLVHFWSMRFEAKHRLSKIAANSTCSRRNICITLSIKNQLKLCHRLSSSFGFHLEQVKYGKKSLLDIDIYEYNYLLKTKATELFVLKWIERLGIKFKKDCLVLIKKCTLPLFGKILDIIDVLNVTYIIYVKYETIGFDEHVQAYEVKKTSDISTIKFHEIDNKVYIINVSPSGTLLVVRQYGL